MDLKSPSERSKSFYLGFSVPISSLPNYNFFLSLFKLGNTIGITFLVVLRLTLPAKKFYHFLIKLKF